MKLRLAQKLFACVVLAAVPLSAMAATVTVNGLPDVVGTSYEKLSSAVAYVQSLGEGPHVVNVTTNSTPIADGQILITTGPLTIEGDADNDGIKCDVLADLASISAAGTANVGQGRKTFIEVQASTGPIVIRNLKIHPNADSTQTGTANAVNGIELYKPLNAGELSQYVLENVWISGSDASNNYVDLGTANDLYATAGIKRWSRNTLGDTTGASDNWGAISLANNGLGQFTAEIKNCHAGLSRSNAMTINSSGSTVTVTGGVYGHSLRNGIRAQAPVLTITGSPTNRVRVLRVPHESGKDAHGVFIASTNVPKIEYVDSVCMSSGNAFKFAGTTTATVELMQFCRAPGKFDAGANSTLYIVEACQLPNISKCTFVGSGSDYRPLQVGGGATVDSYFTDCIFTSEGLDWISADNSDTLNGVRQFTNCALPVDGFTSESLNQTSPIVNNGVTTGFLPATVNSVTVSPMYMKTLADYDWSEAAVSIDGSNPAAGNPDVLRPRTYAYRGAASDGSDLTGGAGGDIPLGTAARDWALYQ